MLVIQPKPYIWLPTILRVRIWYKHRWRQILRPKVKWLPKVALFQRFSNRSRREKTQELCSRLEKAKIGIESVKQRRPKPSKWLEWLIQRWLFCREQSWRWINHPNLQNKIFRNSNKLWIRSMYTSLLKVSQFPHLLLFTPNTLLIGLTHWSADHFLHLKIIFDWFKNCWEFLCKQGQKSKSTQYHSVMHLQRASGQAPGDSSAEQVTTSTIFLPFFLTLDFEMIFLPNMKSGFRKNQSNMTIMKQIKTDNSWHLKGPSESYFLFITLRIWASFCLGSMLSSPGSWYFLFSFQPR